MPTHPSADDLCAFGRGRLSGPAALAVEDHLISCDTCRSALTAVPDDDLVRLVRRCAPALAAATAAGQAAARMEHPGVVPVYGRVADAAGRAGYVMRFVRGRTRWEAVRDYRADARVSLGMLLTARGKPADAVGFLERAVVELDELALDFPRTLPYAASAGDARNHLAAAFVAANRPADAARAWREVVAGLGPVADRFPERTDVHVPVADAALRLGRAALAAKDAEAALRWFDRAAELAERPALRDKPGGYGAAAEAGRAAAAAAWGR